MKQILSFMSIGVCACTTVLAAIQWGSGVENIAKGSTVTVSSNESNAAGITDDNDGTGWQADAATHNYTSDWVLIDLGEEKTFTDMEIVWEASHCKQYSVYVSNDAVTYTTHEANTEENTPGYKAIDADWLETHQPAITRTDNSEATYTDNFTFTDTQKGQYVLIYANEYNDFGKTYGMRIFDVRLANIQNRDEVSSLKIAQEGNAVAGGEAITVNVTPQNKIGETMGNDAISNVQLTCNNEAVAITGGENGIFNVSASKFGTYTLVATAEANGNTVSGEATLQVAFNWDGITNVATGKTISGRVKADTEDTNSPTYAVDGNTATYYVYNGEWAGGDSWMLVDLGDVYMVDAIGVRYSNLTNDGVYSEGKTGGRCQFGYTTDASVINAYMEENGNDFKWNDIPDNEGWTFTPELNRVSDAVTTYAYATPVVARYIAIKDADNPTGKPCVNEIYVAGTVREAPKASNIALNLEKGGMVTGETCNVEATVTDQYGTPFEAEVAINVTGADYTDGMITATGKGMVIVTATTGDITTEANIFVADQNDYCLAGAKITSDGPADTNPVLDGGKEISNNGIFYIISENEPANAQHWVMAELPKPYNLDLIAISWEGACPADYDVYLGESEDNLSLCYSQRDKAGLQNHSDRFSGKEMNNIRFIKVVTTKNATEYGIKMYDLKAYGTSSVTSVADRIELYASDDNMVTGEEVILNAKVIDQFGAEMSDESVAYSCNDTENTSIEGNIFKASTVGEYTVTATCGGITKDIVINVAADADSKMTAEELANRTTMGDVQKEADIFADNEIQISDNDMPAIMTIEFEAPHYFDLLKIRWEAACPSEYSVEAIYTDGTKDEIFSVSGRELINGFNPVDKLVMENQKAVKALIFDIKANNNTNGWPSRLLGMDAYANAAEADLTTEVAIDESGYATAYLPVDVQLPEGLKAYIVSSTSDNTATLTEVDYIKAHQGVVLKAEDAKTYIFHKGNGTSSFNGNLLQGTIWDTYISGNAYILADGTQGTGFYKAALNDEGQFKNNAGKAYLPAESQARVLLFDFGTETGIENIEDASNAAGKTVIYDLSGRRVQGAQKGIYIVNGKKMVK